MTALAPALSPHGVLSLKPSDDAPAADTTADARIERAFARGAGHGLLHLGVEAVGIALPAVLSYWREFGARLERIEQALVQHKLIGPMRGTIEPERTAAAAPVTDGHIISLPE